MNPANSINFTIIEYRIYLTLDDPSQCPSGMPIALLARERAGTATGFLLVCYLRHILVFIFLLSV
jgi:hypothetical protein